MCGRSSGICAFSMRTSATPWMGAVRVNSICWSFKNNKTGNCCHNSVTSPNGMVAYSILPRSRRLDELSSEFYRDGVRKLTFACESRYDVRKIHYRDTYSPSHRRTSQVRAALSTYFTQFPASDGDVTEKWSLEAEILELGRLERQLRACKNGKEKNAVLDSNRRVRGVFGGIGRPGVYVKPSVALASCFLDEVGLYSLKCLVAVGQEHLLEWPSGPRDAYAVQEKLNSRPVSRSPARSAKEVLTRLGDVIESWEGPPGKFWQSMAELLSPWSEIMEFFNPDDKAKFSANDWCSDVTEAGLVELLHLLVAVLVRLEKFYDSIGGIVGYQVRALELARECETQNDQMGFSSSNGRSSQRRQFSVPLGPDLSRDKAYATQAASWGLEGLPAMGEIYPLGGAGDRLGLVDESSGECLPVAMLPYCGRTLLEGLIRDLQAREYLYFKVFGTQHITPVAMMTSSAKGNDQLVYSLCERNGWFGRGKENFRLFEQVLMHCNVTHSDITFGSMFIGLH